MKRETKVRAVILHGDQVIVDMDQAKAKIAIGDLFITQAFDWIGQSCLYRLITDNKQSNNKC